MFFAPLTQFPTSSLRTHIQARPRNQTLYACGFNAHGQLLSAPRGVEPEDLYSFIKIAEGDEIRVRCILWSLTILEIDGTLILHGFQNTSNRNCKIKGPPPDSIKIITGDNVDIVAVTENGAVWTLDLTLYRPAFSKLKQMTAVELEGWVVDHIAIAGNEEVCIATHKKIHTLYDGGKTELISPMYSLHIFTNFASFRDSEFPIHSYTMQAPVTSLCASNTIFTALNIHGEVYTFGDPRHCPYGRIPTIVRPLGGVPISKISTGGWITAALSRDKGLYIYGGRPPGEKAWMKCLPLLNNGEQVSLVNLEDDADIHDIGIGDGHVVALTATGGVWGIGQNNTGQLGMGKWALGKPIAGFHEDWVKIGGEQVWGKGNVVGVWAGENGTFVLAQRDRAQPSD